MFTAAEYQLLVKRVPEDLKDFFAAAGIPVTALDWENTEKVNRLDEEAEKRVVDMLRCKSLIDGCYTLLERAKIPYRFSDTTGALLTSIVEHQSEVRRAMTLMPRPAGKMSAKIKPAVPKLSTKSEGNKLYQFAGAGFLVADIVLLLASKTHPIILVVLGFAGAFMMAKGGGSKESERVRAEPISVASRDAAEKSSSFTEEEAAYAIKVLLSLQRLYQAL